MEKIKRPADEEMDMQYVQNERDALEDMSYVFYKRRR